MITAVGRRPCSAKRIAVDDFIMPGAFMSLKRGIGLGGATCGSGVNAGICSVGNGPATVSPTLPQPPLQKGYAESPLTFRGLLDQQSPLQRSRERLVSRRRLRIGGLERRQVLPLAR